MTARTPLVRRAHAPDAALKSGLILRCKHTLTPVEPPEHRRRFFAQLAAQLSAQLAEEERGHG
ncbi:hypothetical protein PSAC2689_130013 [Paraburkholderia sacchari]